MASSETNMKYEQHPATTISYTTVRTPENTNGKPSGEHSQNYNTFSRFASAEHSTIIKHTRSTPANTVRSSVYMYEHIYTQTPIKHHIILHICNVRLSSSTADVLLYSLPPTFRPHTKPTQAQFTHGKRQVHTLYSDEWLHIYSAHIGLTAFTRMLSQSPVQ